MRKVQYFLAPLLLVLTFVAGDRLATAEAGDPPPPTRLEDLIQSIEALQERFDSPEEALKLLRIEQRILPTDLRPPDGHEFFEKNIRPLFAENCYSCHSAEKQMGDLRLDRREGVFADRQSGPVVVPGNKDASRLLQVISHLEEIKMPPKKKLDPIQIDLITEWIAMGAPWPEDRPEAVAVISMEEKLREARESHWAFQPVFDATPPTPAAEGWSDRPIDAFIAARLEDEGLSPSSLASPAALLRRLYFDLIGLPPTRREMEAFLADPSEEAYGEVVRKLLASPHFGERWGRHWLDVARYADTKGYVFNQERDFPYSHTYRDYVIRAYNEDLPYDKFLIHQIAADHLELGDDKRPLAALGFLTLGRRFVGNIHDVVDDQIDVVTRGTLGLTVTCARCHEHKFDPIPTEDYYSLYGVFRSSEEPAEFPTIEEPDPNDPLYQEYLAAVGVKKKELEDHTDRVHLELLSAARERIGGYLAAAAKVWRATDGVDYRKIDVGVRLEPNLIREWHKFLKRRTESFDPLFEPWRALGALPETGSEIESASLAARFAANADPDHPLHPLVAEAFRSAATPTLEDAAKIYAELFERADRTWKSLLASKAQAAVQSGAGSIELPEALPEPELESLRRILYTADGPLDIARDRVDALVDRDERNRFTDLRNAVARVENSHPGRPNRAQALVDASNLFDPYVFRRGKPGAKGDPVPRQFLTILTSERQPFERGSGRLDLAEAIASKDNPLTARVYVNRVWMHLFGRPLVDTPSDFGVRSEPPTHPQLLDHLAARFMAEGWSTKRLIESIVTSRAYRQSSDHRPDCAAADSENRLLWRQNRRRLNFEAMRDSLLVASGQLDRRMGGFSVDIVNPPFTSRRTVYSLIERQNLPDLFRTFDFASPDMHSPRRFETVVPQQALFLLNSPFIADSAVVLASRARESAGEDPEDLVSTLYDLTLHREPTPEELELGMEFLDRQSSAPPPSPPEEPVWKYGYGKYDEEQERVAEFTHFPHYGDEEWKIGPRVPDAELGWLTLGRLGGHSEVEHAVVRRWVSPVTATLSIEGHLAHRSPNGDGVVGYLVSSREGLLWSGHAHDARIPTDASGTKVLPGDTIDLVVSSGPTNGYDSFVWHPRIWVSDGVAEGGARREWLSRLDFAGPPAAPPKPLEPLEQYAQVLLLTNEFLFVD